MSATTFERPVATTRSVTGISTGKLAVWWILASEIVIFGGFLVYYLLMRFHHGDVWMAESAHTRMEAGAINTFVLLTSSLFAVLAHQAAESGDGKKAAKFLWYTIGGALVFLCVKGWEWTGEITHGYTLTKNIFWGCYYCITGLHGVHVVAGAIIMAFVAKDAAKGKDLQRVECIGIYWHFVDIVWLFLFPLFYTSTAG
jgi:heme/copper-type cytochrome/quinol oxidase subunit 3